MHLDSLEIIQNITPRWGAGHYLARHPNGDLLEVLVAERSSESVTSLLSWAHALERIDHPCLPYVQTIVHQETTFVALKLREGSSLAHWVQRDREKLHRFDILCLFFQLATALRKLHDHRLNHGNLTLDHMLLVGDGKLQLRGWAPPALETTFALRQFDELKRFKSFFFLTIVGQFPPQNRTQAQTVTTNINPIEAQRLAAWSEWYHEEARRPRPNLSSTRLMLFDDPPEDAQAIVDELVPHLEESFRSFYHRLNNEAEMRDDFDLLFQKREQLLLEIERIKLTTQLWLARHEANSALSEQHHQQLEVLFNDTELLQEQLSLLSGHRFDTKEVVEHPDYRIQRSAHTALYELSKSKPSAPLSTEHTFGASLFSLDQQWSQVDPDAPLRMTHTELNHLHPLQLSPSSHQTIGDLKTSPLASEWANLPPVIVHPSSTQSPAALSVSPSHQAQHSEALSELGIAPLPSPHELNQATNTSLIIDDAQSTQFFERLRDRYPSQQASRSMESQQDISMLGMSALLPGHTKTVFTEHYQNIEDAQREDLLATGPKVAFSHRNFFTFLYLAAGVVFLWSLKDVTDSSPTRLPSQSVPSASGVQQEAIPIDVDFGISEEFPASSLPDASVPTTPAPPPDIPPPEGMAFIPGGEVSNSYSDQVYQQLLTTSCVFAPSFSGGRQKSREVCKRLIPKPSSERTYQVTPFFLDIYEVSRGDYLRYCRSGGVCDRRPHFAPDELKLPMVNVTMIQAADYCAYYKKHLPTYEQWLFASRGTQDYAYPWGNRSVLDGRQYRANYRSDRRKRGRSYRELDGYRSVHPVRFSPKLGASPFGIAHMAGNVREWISRNRRKRGWATGGSWKTKLWELRIGAGEYLDYSEFKSDDLGFRCAQRIVEQ